MIHILALASRYDELTEWVNKATAGGIYKATSRRLEWPGVVVSLGTYQDVENGIFAGLTFEAVVTVSHVPPRLLPYIRSLHAPKRTS